MASQDTKKYYEAVGRRKMAVARVRITEASKQSIVVNDRKFEEYFPTGELQNTVTEALKNDETPLIFTISAHIKGGGSGSQAIAFRLGIARALIKYNIELRGSLKERGFLKRDARIKERKKFGLRKARRAPQWSKR